MIEMTTFYTDIPDSATSSGNIFNLRRVQCEGLIAAGVPLVIRERAREMTEDRIIKVYSAFTLNPQVRDLIAEFEDTIGITSKMRVAGFIEKGDYQSILSLLNQIQQDDLTNITNKDLTIIQRGFMMACIRSPHHEEVASIYDNYRASSLERLSSTDLIAWVAQTYKAKLPSSPNLLAVIKDYKAALAEENPTKKPQFNGVV